MNMTCIACGHALSPLMTLDDMPASAQNIPAASELAEDHPLSLTLCQCPSCGLVQFDTEPVDYYRDVIRAGGGTRTMTRLRHEEYARLLTAMQEHHIHGGCFINFRSADDAADKGTCRNACRPRFPVQYIQFLLGQANLKPAISFYIQPSFLCRGLTGVAHNKRNLSGQIRYLTRQYRLNLLQASRRDSFPAFPCNGVADVYFVEA